MQKKVLVIQPNRDDEAAFLGTWLEAERIAFDVVDSDAGDALPANLNDYAALAMLGGPMSVNDDLPFLHASLALFHKAIAQHKPIVGHCLGGQLLARALGARVSDNAVPEIGWSAIDICTDEDAQVWLGDAPVQTVYQWHYQTFALPEGATLLAHNAACAHQAFSLGPHIGMQFHVEVDATKLTRWTAQMRSSLREEFEAVAHHASVQSPEAARASTALHLAQSQQLAARIYARWWQLALHNALD